MYKNILHIAQGKLEKSKIKYTQPEAVPPVYSVLEVVRWLPFFTYVTFSLEKIVNIKNEVQEAGRMPAQQAWGPDFMS